MSQLGSTILRVRLPGWCWTCGGWGGRHGPPAASPVPCRHSSSLQSLHLLPRQKDSEWTSTNKKKDYWERICWLGKCDMDVLLLCLFTPIMKVDTWQACRPSKLASMKVSMLSIKAWARPMMNWFTHAIACDLWSDRKKHALKYSGITTICLLR